MVTSALPVDRSPVLNPVDDYHLGVTIDRVDYSVVATASGIKTGEFTDQSLAGSLRILPDRSRKSDDCGVADLCWERVQVPKTFRSDPDLIHRVRRLRYLAVARFHPRQPRTETVQ